MTLTCNHLYFFFQVLVETMFNKSKVIFKAYIMRIMQADMRKFFIFPLHTNIADIMSWGHQ